MEFIIGVNPDSQDADAMALGSLLCRALGARPVLAHIYPTAFDYPSMAHVDGEWNEYLRGQAREMLDEAAQQFCSRFDWEDVEVAMAGHRSSGRGLAEMAEARGSALIVVGSAPGASVGRFSIGSTADKLLHNSPVPVGVAPMGYARDGIEHIGRVVVAFQNTAESLSSLIIGAEYAEQMQVPLRVLTLLIRHRVYGSKLGADAEAGVLRQIEEDSRTAHERALAEISIAVPTDSVTPTGDSVRSALQRVDWEGDEILLLGSSGGGPLRRVFLGDMTYKLVRATGVPAVVLPRRT
ncbi:MAG: universal stress protein [Actinobacteria bacterium]|nr:universal stress protein [Actinomycetota bacterium]